jgi:CheY-like chemotaxis protein
MPPAESYDVLLVEDDADLRETVSEVLQDRGLLAVAAANGRQALDVLRSEAGMPAVILLDLMMPVMDGWEFLVHKREDPGLARLPVVVLTAYAGSSDLAQELGVERVLKKPIELAQLIDVLDQYRTSAA